MTIVETVNLVKAELGRAALLCPGSPDSVWLVRARRRSRHDMMTPAPRPKLVLLADAAAEIICSGLGGAAAMPTPTQLRERLDELDAVAAKGGVAAR